MENKEFKYVTMDAREALKATLHAGYAGRDGRDRVAFEEFVVDIEGDKWIGQFAEVLLECRCDSVDVEVGVRDIVVGWVLFKAFPNLLDLRATARFAVNTLHIHA